MAELNFGKVATVCGRMYAMDRDNRWERVVKAYDMLALGQGEQYSCPLQAIQASYDNGVGCIFQEQEVEFTVTRSDSF